MFDPIAIIWLSLWASIGSYGLYLLKFDDKKASEFYVYGKSLNLKNKKGLFWQLFLLPKSYFRHFYLSSVLTFIASVTLVLIYYVPSKTNSKLNNLFVLLKSNILPYYNIRVETTKSLPEITSLIFTIILMVIQCSRRLYESLFVSVYSANSKINIIHYLFGHVFYILAAISTICPILLSETSNKFTFTNLIDNLVTKQRALSFVLFIYASHQQHRCHVILANLRKDKTGQVITQQHYVPSGGSFELVSCPHFSYEVLIYLTILISQEFKISYWLLIFLLVATTQTINAVTEHKWYRTKYKDYPKERKAIIPKLL